MLGRLLGGAALAAATAIGTVAVVDRRFGPPAPGGVAHDTLRRLNHHVTNPLMLQAAKLGLSYPAVLEHRGRRSGQAYRTPVAVSPSPVGFVIPLPYGEGVDWAKNVLAGGGATLRWKNQPFDVTNPRVVGQEEAFALCDPRHRDIWKRWGIERFLVVEWGAPRGAFAA